VKEVRGKIWIQIKKEKEKGGVIYDWEHP